MLGLLLRIGVLTVLAAGAWAQNVEEMTVTGSYIQGTAKDAELPVDVIGAEDLEAIGSPTAIELVRNLGITSGSLGETNQFQPGGRVNEGMANINLRGLGASRTLVLINGRRHVATERAGVDINAFPVGTIGRIEVLKDGAAALYGSDAIGGVVNIITKKAFNGFEIGGNYQQIDGSDGDSSINTMFGLARDRWSMSLALEYAHRAELKAKTRNWAIQPFDVNPESGWSGISTPGNIIVGGTPQGTPSTRDPGCQLFGGYRNDKFGCGFQYTPFFNLIEDTDAYRLFGQGDYALSSNVNLHVEGLWSKVDLGAWKTSPSYPPQSLTGPDRRVYPDHPGYIDMVRQYPDLFPAVDPVMYPDGIPYVTPITRPRSVTGKGPNGDPEQATRDTFTTRIVLGLDGTLFDGALGFNVGMNYSTRIRKYTDNDMYVERMAFALRGLGGANCDRNAAYAAGTFGQNGCLYFNPFSNGIQRSAVNGAVNPNFVPALANAEELFDWMITDTFNREKNTLLVFDAIFNADTGITLPGGIVSWAGGIQTRRERFAFRTSPNGNRNINPCPFNDPLSVTLGFTPSLDCPSRTGLLGFLAGTDPANTDRTVYGIFSEFALPITDKINAQLAVRFEDYGGNVGSTIDPKLAFSYRPTGAVTLRGSVSTTFRGPPQSFLNGTRTVLQYVPATLAFKAADTQGNPNLTSEKALSTNIGVIYQRDNFYMSVDYWRFAFKDPFQVESLTQITNAYDVPSDTNPGGLDCQDGGAGVATDTCIALRQHITPFGVKPSGIERIAVNNLNGEDITMSGTDIFAQYDFTDVILPGMVSFGAQGTYTIASKSDDFLDINGALLAPGGDFAGKLNDGDPFTPLPKTKGNVFVKYSLGRHRGQVIARYVGPYKDVRPSLPNLATVERRWTIDMHYNVAVTPSTMASLTIVNVTDRYPPMTSTDLNYDIYTHSSYGRMFKLGFKYTMER